MTLTEAVKDALDKELSRALVSAGRSNHRYGRRDDHNYGRRDDHDSWRSSDDETQSGEDSESSFESRKSAQRKHRTLRKKGKASDTAAKQMADLHKLVSKSGSSGGRCIFTRTRIRIPQIHLVIVTLLTHPKSRTDRGGGGKASGRKAPAKGGGGSLDSGPCFAFGNKKFGNKGPGCSKRNCPYRHSLSESEKKKAKKGNLWFQCKGVPSHRDRRENHRPTQPDPELPRTGDGGARMLARAQRLLHPQVYPVIPVRIVVIAETPSLSATFSTTTNSVWHARTKASTRDVSTAPSTTISASRPWK